MFNMFRNNFNKNNNMNMKQLYQDCMNNPMQLLSQMNPQMAQVLQFGGNPEMVVRKLCEQRGINADEFINNLKSKIG